MSINSNFVKINIKINHSNELLLKRFTTMQNFSLIGQKTKMGKLPAIAGNLPTPINLESKALGKVILSKLLSVLLEF